jgi:hypothetical protein
MSIAANDSPGTILRLTVTFQLLTDAPEQHRFSRGCNASAVSDPGKGDSNPGRHESRRPHTALRRDSSATAPPRHVPGAQRTDRRPHRQTDEPVTGATLRSTAAISLGGAGVNSIRHGDVSMEWNSVPNQDVRQYFPWHLMDNVDYP